MNIAKITYLLTWAIGWMVYEDMKRDPRNKIMYPGHKLAAWCFGSTHVVYFIVLGVIFFFNNWG